jgi:alpha-beta hydrolase superfamily lysophospholipase
MSRTSLLTTDKVSLHARHWLQPTTPRAAVVIAHGFTASSNDADLVAVAEALHAHDFDVTTYDARGHGRSGGSCTLGDLERHDVAAAVACARERTHDVVLLGVSMGAIAVLRYAAADRGLAGLVTVSCPARWTLPRNARAIFAALLTRTAPGRRAAAHYLGVSIAPRWTNPEPPVALARRVHVPYAIVHGAADPFIPESAAHELYDAAREPKVLQVVPGMGHALQRGSVDVVVDSVEWTLQVRTAL